MKRGLCCFNLRRRTNGGTLYRNRDGLAYHPEPPHAFGGRGKTLPSALRAVALCKSRNLVLTLSDADEPIQIAVIALSVSRKTWVLAERRHCCGKGLETGLAVYGDSMGGGTGLVLYLLSVNSPA